jgi:hypothetical protein
VIRLPAPSRPCSPQAEHGDLEHLATIHLIGLKGCDLGGKSLSPLQPSCAVTES